VEHFDSKSCLKTYHAERNPSLSANCNALLSLLLDPQVYDSKDVTIEKLTRFICEQSKRSGTLEDKWVSQSIFTISIDLIDVFVEPFTLLPCDAHEPGSH
jgi:hypothetical protein